MLARESKVGLQAICVGMRLKYTKATKLVELIEETLAHDERLFTSDTAVGKIAKAIAQENAAVTTVKCPSLCITSEFRQGLVGPTRDEDDGPPGGWMVLPLEDSGFAPTPRDAAHHLVWPIDSF